MRIGLPQYTSHSDTYARCPALPGPVWSAAREGDVLGFELTCRERRFATRRDQQHLNGLAHLKVRVPKVARSGLRLRVVLRSPELPCESLPGFGRAGGECRA